MALLKPCSTSSHCTGIDAQSHLTAWQATADSVVAVAQEVGYPNAFICSHLLVGSLTQLLYLLNKIICDELPAAQRTMSWSCL